MSFDALAESCKSLLAMPTVCPNTGSIPTVSGTSVDVDKPPSFQFVSVSPKIERKPLAVPLMFGPNITGKHANPNFQIFDAQYFGKGLSGAFTLETTSNRRGILDSDGAYSGANFLFDASRSNSTYGSSSMVQPASTRLLACIKI